jgi:hypothetical protein
MTRREELAELITVLTRAVADAEALAKRLRRKLARAEDELAELLDVD